MSAKQNRHLRKALNILKLPHLTESGNPVRHIRRMKRLLNTGMNVGQIIGTYSEQVTRRKQAQDRRNKK